MILVLAGEQAPATQSSDVSTVAVHELPPPAIEDLDDTFLGRASTASVARGRAHPSSLQVAKRAETLLVCSVDVRAMAGGDR